MHAESDEIDLGFRDRLLSVVMSIRSLELPGRREKIVAAIFWCYRSRSDKRTK